MNVFILAAGEGERHPMNLKQLLEAGEETIIERIIRQCNARDQNPFIVTHKKQLQKLAWIECKANFYHPRERRWIVETLYSTRELWGEKTIVLLGDVIYSKDALDQIFKSISSFCWFGDTAESYAIVFSRGVKDRMIQSCLNVIDKNYPPYQGTLRQLMFDYTGLTEKLLFASRNPHIRGISDYTRDIDTKEDYSNFKREVVTANRLDDLP